MSIEQLNESKVPIIVLDKKLEELRGKVLFPEKLKRANEILAKTGLPTLKKKRIKIEKVIQFGIQQEIKVSEATDENLEPAASNNLT